MLDQDPTNGNQYWATTAGNYTDGASAALRANNTEKAVKDHFPRLRASGMRSINGNGMFQGCKDISDRCDQLATLYYLYADTRTDAKEVLCASLKRAKAKATSSPKLIDWAIRDIANDKKEPDMLSVIIAATADRDVAYTLDTIRYLIVHYHAQIRRIAETPKNHALIAAADYFEDLVETKGISSIESACNIARTLADVLAALGNFSVDPSSLLLARTWVDLTAAGNVAFPQMDARKKLNEAAESIVNNLDFSGLDSNKIVESVKNALNADKKKQAEDAEKQKQEYVQETAHDLKIQLEAHHTALGALGVTLDRSKYDTLAELTDVYKQRLAAKYETKDKFRNAYRTAARSFHPDKAGKSQEAAHVYLALGNILTAMPY